MKQIWRDWFWPVVAAVVVLYVFVLLGCAASSSAPLTPLEADLLRCRAVGERICGTSPYSIQCRRTAQRECIALMGWQKKGGKLVKRRCEP